MYDVVNQEAVIECILRSEKLPLRRIRVIVDHQNASTLLVKSPGHITHSQVLE